MSDDDIGGTTSEPHSFLPTRDLPPLRPLPATEVILVRLGKLAQAIGLGQERVVRLALEDLDEDDQRQLGSPTLGTEDAEDVDDEDTPAPADTIESRFAQTWLTRIISSSSLSEELDLQDKAGEVLAALCGNPGEHIGLCKLLRALSN